jgi:hypothetical protein
MTSKGQKEGLNSYQNAGPKISTIWPKFLSVDQLNKLESVCNDTQNFSHVLRELKLKNGMSYKAKWYVLPSYM